MPKSAGSTCMTRTRWPRSSPAATNLKWLNSIYAGVEHFPLEQLKAQGTILTNGAGLNSAPIAEFAVMMMLAAAKRSDILLDNQRQHVWLETPPGTAEIDDSKALIIGYGGIGQQIAKKLSGFDVEVTAVRRTADRRSQCHRAR